MLFGMGTVFVFLAVLVMMTTLMSLLVQRWLAAAPEPVDPLPGSAATQDPIVAAERDATLVAVISAAIHRHRQANRQDP